MPFFIAVVNAAWIPGFFKGIWGCSRVKNAPLPSQFCITADFPAWGELISLGLQGVQAQLNMTPGALTLLVWAFLYLVV